MIRMLALLAFLLPAAAQAQTPCGPTDQVMAELTGRHQETPRVIGLSSNGGLLQVWASPDGRTWTVTTTDPDSQLTCLQAAGRHLEMVTPPIPVEPPA